MMPSLDLLILSLVEAGIDTPYRWQSRAGLSLGGTLPAVRRLLALHLVSEAATGPRGRREFTITPAGRSELKRIDRYVEDALLEPVGDLESVLRLFAIALQAGRQDAAAGLLEDAAAEYDRRAGRAQKRASDSSEEDGLAALYLATTSHCEAERLQAQAASLRSLLSQFRKVRSGKKAARPKQTKPRR
jgi:DNA-binding PadR family transcriptional regulator